MTDERSVTHAGVGAHEGPCRAAAAQSHASAGEPPREPALPPSDFYDWDAATAHRALVELGDTPAAIAQKLRELGIRGNQLMICGCPVARYLTSRLEIQMGVTRAHCFPRHGLHNGISLPHAVAVFVELFERGAYPDLVEVA